MGIIALNYKFPEQRYNMEKKRMGKAFFDIY